MERNQKEGIIPAQNKATYLLASGNKVKDVAENVGVDRATIWNWKKEPSFIALLNNLRNEIRDSSRSAIWSLHSEAEETLKKCLNSNNEPVRLRSALAILNRIEALPEGETDAELIKADKKQKEFFSRLKAGVV